eukprot:3690095-Prymnesium_polylepis.1
MRRARCGVGRACLTSPRRSCPPRVQWVVKKFSVSVTATVLQMAIGTVVMLSFWQWHKFGTWDDLGKWTVVSLVWGLNLATSNIALANASLGLVMIMRNWCAGPHAINAATVALRDGSDAVGALAPAAAPTLRRSATHPRVPPPTR